MSLLTRPFGPHQEPLSIIGIGGVTVVGQDREQATRLFDLAIDSGINYVDVAPSYGSSQETEVRFGEALQGRRNRVFLACKTADRSAIGARMELERSLAHLKTDYFDLYQLHEITSVEEVDRAFEPDGCMTAIIAAQQSGMVRHIGFSAHSVEAAIHALERYSFASALIPINFVTTYSGGFGPQIIDACQRHKTSILALKAMALTHWTDDDVRTFPNCWYSPIEDEQLSELALRWTLSQPVTAAVPPGDLRLFHRALTFAQRFTPIEPDEIAFLKHKAEGIHPIFSAS